QMFLASRYGARRRGAFTLVELLVVLSIIAILIALSAAATLRFLGVQPATDTRTQLQRLDSTLRTQWSAVADQARKEPIPADIRPAIEAIAGGDTERTRVIWVKLRLKQAFPTSFAEALNPAPLQALPAYQSFLTQLQYTAQTPPGPFDSAACLLMALQ